MFSSQLHLIFFVLLIEYFVEQEILIFFFVVLGVKLRVLRNLGKCSAADLYLKSTDFHFE